MLLAGLMFFVGAGLVVGAYMLIVRLPGTLASRRLERRMKEVSAPTEPQTRHQHM
jgi:hypothetical protein